MANALFTVYRNNMLGDNTFANVQWDADTFGALFVDEGTDTPVPATDQDVADILGGAQVPAFASAPNLSTITIGSVAAGVIDADDLVFTSLSGASVESLILFKDTGTDTTSILIAYFDTFSSGMPLTPNGGNVTVQWNASGIFQV